MTDILKAILAIDSNAKCSVYNEDINSIKWTSTPIPKADIEAKMTELQAEHDAEEWKRNRQAEYPNLQDCIHALLDGGDTLTELQAKRTATKNKYPKPGA
jgi:hypothetical protein